MNIRRLRRKVRKDGRLGVAAAVRVLAGDPLALGREGVLESVCCIVDPLVLTVEAAALCTIQATIGGRTLLLGGDVILAVLGVPIGDETYEQRRERMRQLPPGAPLILTVLRDGRQITLSRIGD